MRAALAAQSNAFYRLDLDGDGDIDLYDWSAWEASFLVPSVTAAVALEHCTRMDGKFTRVYALPGECGTSEGVAPDTKLWISVFQWPLHIKGWVAWVTGPKR